MRNILTTALWLLACVLCYRYGLNTMAARIGKACADVVDDIMQKDEPTDLDIAKAEAVRDVLDILMEGKQWTT